MKVRIISSCQITRSFSLFFIFLSQSISLETEKQVSVVVDQTGCTREVAIKALKETNGDVVNAILVCLSH